MNLNSTRRKEHIVGTGFIDSVLSWSVNDLLNKDLYRGQVTKIPETFASTEDYMKAFILPLLEETRADLSSTVEAVSRSPTCEILQVRKTKKFAPPENLFYEITVKQNEGAYQPLNNHLVALTCERPKCVNDLRGPGDAYLVAVVRGVREMPGNSYGISILSSQAIFPEDAFLTNNKPSNVNKKTQKMFAVYLTDLTTNLRIWRALNSELEGNNMNIISEVLNNKFSEVENCTICSSRKMSAVLSQCLRDILSANLNDSQKTAVLSCVGSPTCSHRNTVKVIWGPPGTGKTKTTSHLLYTLFKIRCRTLTCAPTNNAVIEVATRVLGLAVKLLQYGTYGMGDIVLFGNKERMKIDGKNDLLDIFLDHRVEILKDCLTGWSRGLASMICLLEDPDMQYQKYQLEADRRKEDKQDDNGEEVVQEQQLGKKDHDQCNDKETVEVVQALSTKLTIQEESHLKQEYHESIASPSMSKSVELTFEEFILNKFTSFSERLKFCVQNVCKHLPTSAIPLAVIKNMVKALDLIRSLETSLLSASASDGRFRAILREAKTECLLALKSLPQTFDVPTSNLEMFCLKRASLLFCTVSSSVKLHVEGMVPFKFMVIDEAAQLKECESTIPLLLPGLQHAILIGDEQQLPAMVNSKISEAAEFGRSLFERLVKLRWKSHLLDIQYRMHPSISIFPNRKFYDKKILDGPNVKEASYSRRFLEGNMYGSYSFINISQANEEFDELKSLKNTVEAAVVVDIVERLYKEFNSSKGKISIGIISPYNAQVRAIQGKLGKYGSDSNSDFSVNVGSVDGFQGGEKDVIILTTVRCNTKGAVGFVSNRQRANVALTRARYCLWILGNEETLIKSGSIWENLVIDAKERQCFYNADEDRSLLKAINNALIERGNPHTLLQRNSALFKKARWKVCFSDDFLKSMRKLDNGIHKKVLLLLSNLADGWRLSSEESSLKLSLGVSQLLELYKISKKLYIVWTVDVESQTTFHLQVLKVWGIVTVAGIRKLANSLESTFSSYSEAQMNRCKHKSVQGDLVVPIKWPDETNSAIGGSSSRPSDLQLAHGSSKGSLQPQNIHKSLTCRWILRRSKFQRSHSEPMIIITNSTPSAFTNLPSIKFSIVASVLCTARDLVGVIIAKQLQILHQ